jgi:hypothetical protein
MNVSAEQIASAEKHESSPLSCGDELPSVAGEDRAKPPKG